MDVRLAVMMMRYFLDFGPMFEGLKTGDCPTIAGAAHLLRLRGLCSAAELTALSHPTGVLAVVKRGWLSARAALARLVVPV